MVPKRVFGITMMRWDKSQKLTMMQLFTRTNNECLIRITTERKTLIKTYGMNANTTKTCFTKTTFPPIMNWIIQWIITNLKIYEMN